jgi:hypothetical protein
MRIRVLTEVETPMNHVQSIDVLRRVWTLGPVKVHDQHKGDDDLSGTGHPCFYHGMTKDNSLVGSRAMTKTKDTIHAQHRLQVSLVQR